MHILHVTPHLPPDQAANALLPAALGAWACDRGDTVEYAAHPPRSGGTTRIVGPVTWIARRSGGLLDRGLRLGSVFAAARVRRALTALVDRADLIHAHSNGLLPELAVLLAARRQKPVVLTLYGTEIWHYSVKPFGPDLFTRAYNAASLVTFYSERLMTRARELGLSRKGMRVIYPPVGDAFAWRDQAARMLAREALGLTNRHVLLNVKRLHPLAGQRHLIDAMNEVIRVHPDTRLVICGSGPLLEQLKHAARTAGVERHVTFAGLVDNATIARYCAAADAFVLPSLLEALPTVAVEALACGTPVISTDNPGGLELNELFGSDVAVVPREQAMPLAAAIIGFLQQKRRTLDKTRDVLDRLFRPSAVAAQFADAYAQATAEVRA